MGMFNKNKKYILDGGGGQTLLDLGLKPLGALWSATALIDEKYNHLVTKCINSLLMLDQI